MSSNLTAPASSSTHAASNRFETRFSHREAGFSLLYFIAHNLKKAHLFVGTTVGSSIEVKIGYQQTRSALWRHGTDDAFLKNTKHSRKPVGDKHSDG